MEAIQEVHQQQFLVLLLVLQAELHQGWNTPSGGSCSSASSPASTRWRQASTAAMAGRLSRPALRPGMARADGVVIGVELIAPERVAGMSSCMGLQHEGVEEPGGVAQMPFGRTGIAIPWSIRSSGSRGAISASLRRRTASRVSSSTSPTNLRGP